VVLVVGGKYHDFDFARLELLKLVAEHDELRVRVQPDYEDTSGLDAAAVLVSYTCDVRPSPAAQQRVRAWVEGGGRWLALHGTNAALGDASVRPVATPRAFPLWVDTLGSQFVAHPPIEPYRVEVTDPDHWLVAGVEPFDATDELYLSEYADRGVLTPLLHTTWQGVAGGFVDSDWTATDAQHLVMYLRPLGRGALQHARPLPRPLRHDARQGLLPERRPLLVGAPRVLRAAPAITALGPRRELVNHPTNTTPTTSTQALR
jgi:uncharacterized protein